MFLRYAGLGVPLCGSVVGCGNFALAQGVSRNLGFNGLAERLGAMAKRPEAGVFLVFVERVGVFRHQLVIVAQGLVQP